MADTMYYAHKNDAGAWQTILSHAEGTAERAALFAASFDAENAGSFLGRYHDVGKYANQFQARLHGSHESYEHSSAGMIFCYEDNTLGNAYARMLYAYAIAGHHAGLPDHGSDASDASDGTFCGKKKRKNDVPLQQILDRSELGEMPPLPPLPTWVLARKIQWFSYQFYGRMLYSVLVDADFLDTEAFMSSGTIQRMSGADFATLQTLFDQHMQRFDGKEGVVNQRRQAILTACRCAGVGEKGVYRLTVPTGGGKTLSSMAFALRQVQTHHMQRIIYVIPYISIIRQTVENFQEIFGKENVLGHYSTSEELCKSDEEVPSPAVLATENWDVPIVVTTNVQFFESLYGSQSSVCRKLHNIANSVILFDEAQMLPVKYLRPCLRAITELVAHYGCTTVLCTATQPALENLLAEQHITAAEICPDTADMYADLRRVRYQFLGKCTDESIGEKVQQYTQALCICNSRKTTRQLYDTWKGKGVYHLSTWMTHAHLGRKIEEIRERLANGERCIVFSTSLIEAGVDVDFPVVFREMTGLDSILQSGGRCNREGKASLEDSVVYVFEREDDKNSTLEKVSNTRTVQNEYEDIGSPEAIHRYFQLLYRCSPSETVDKLDRENILPLIEQKEDTFKKLNYREVARRFHLIDQTETAILIPNGQNAADCAALREGKLNRGLLRRLSADCASVTKDGLRAMERVLSGPYGGMYILEDSEWYDDHCGLVFRETGEALFG